MRSISALKAGLMAATALGLGGLAAAQSAPGDLEARIAALEAMVGELKGELAATRAATDTSLVRVEKKVDEAAAKPATVPGGIEIGETTLSFGGYVDLDAHITNTSDGTIPSSSIARDFYIPGAIPVGGAGNTTTDFTLQATRFYFDAKRDVGGRKVSGHIELDFLGSAQGDERVSNSFSPRLRTAWLDVDGKWRIGQDWSTFQNVTSIPESASFLVASDGMVFIRQPLIRYTLGAWQFALENGDTTYTPYTGAGGRVEADAGVLPDAVVRYNIKGDFGNVSVSGLLRQLAYDTGIKSGETFGWGVSVSGLVKTGGKDDVRFNVFGGEGVGRYVGLNTVNAAVENAAGELEAIPVYGGLVAWRHPFGETARLSVGYSGLFADHPDFTFGTPTKQTQSAFAAILWDIAPKVTVGTELLYGIRELESGTDGELSRFTFSTKYTF